MKRGLAFVQSSYFFVSLFWGLKHLHVLGCLDTHLLLPTTPGVACFWSRGDLVWNGLLTAKHMERLGRASFWNDTIPRRLLDDWHFKETVGPRAFFQSYTGSICQ